MRNLLIVIALFLGVFLIIGRFSEVNAIIETFQHGDLLFIFVALIVEGLWLLNVAASFQAIYRSIGLEETIKELLILATAANFVNIVAPSVGMGGIAVFVSQARKRDYSPARAATAGALYALFDYLGFFCVLWLGLIVLTRYNHLGAAEITASIILVTAAILLTVLMYLGARSSEALGQTLAWMAHQVNRLVRPLIHREYISEQHARDFAHDAGEGLQEIRKTPENLLMPAFLALNNKALLLTILLLVFLAFKVPFTASIVIAGFSIAYLFMIVSPTPSGVGVVEGVLTLTLHSLDIPLEAAVVVTLAYRGITFWVPFFFGFLSLRILGNKKIKGY